MIEDNLTALTTLSSKDTKYDVVVEGKRERLTMREMFDRYAERAKYNELAFDQFGAARGHSREKVEEFFAEAMAVFNGEDISAQARLLRMAPELYAWLEQRNQNARLPIPDRTLLGRVR